MSQEKITSFLLRAGLAFVFLYASISAFLHPQDWIGYFPIWLKNLFPSDLLLKSHSIGEILLAIWLLSGKKLVLASAVSVIALLGIIFANLELMDIIFRDVGLLLAALALLFLSRE